MPRRKKHNGGNAEAKIGHENEKVRLSGLSAQTAGGKMAVAREAISSIPVSRRARLMGASAIPGGALRGLAIVSGMGTVVGASPALAQGFSGAAGVLDTPACEPTAATSGSSTAVGLGANATGAAATAYGDIAVANGDIATATGANSTANGVQATATGAASTANGGVATATGANSVANGNQATATGQASFANGAFATATGQQTFADGANPHATGRDTTPTRRPAT